MAIGFCLLYHKSKKMIFIYMFKAAFKEQNLFEKVAKTLYNYSNDQIEDGLKNRIVQIFSPVYANGGYIEK
ncbi:hypothetical protein LY28_03303 [Ruminiclostridium sufflavum DSM 19573]|uniref:Uncharacterized protein n=1 Tax=Ruminiclostridium sufflavum DSM 19573 TaxID=1121337 RepID=A0A318XGG7_9FIRM|nr:hypothetical protein LY28_03303 [Ruminiclostridium sufflavum DSM 19573]